MPRHDARTAQQEVTRRLIRLPEVIKRTGVSRSWVYQQVKKGLFPAPIPLHSTRVSVWVEQEVEDWIAHTIQTARPDAKREG